MSPPAPRFPHAPSLSRHRPLALVVFVAVTLVACERADEPDEATATPPVEAHTTDGAEPVTPPVQDDDTPSRGAAASVDACSAGELVLARHVDVQSSTAPSSATHTFDIDGLVELCTLVEVAPHAAAHVHLDAEPLLAPAPRKGNLVPVRAMALPGTHELATLLDALPGSQIAVEARVAHLDLDTTTGQTHKLRVLTPVAVPPLFSPGIVDGRRDQTELATRVELLPGVGQQSANLEWTFEIAASTESAPVRVLTGSRSISGPCSDPKSCPILREDWDGRDQSGALVADATWLARAHVQLTSFAAKQGPGARVIDNVTTPWIEVTVDNTAPAIDAHVVDGYSRVPLAAGLVYETPARTVSIVGDVVDTVAPGMSIEARLGADVTTARVGDDGRFELDVALPGDAATAVDLPLTVTRTDQAGNLVELLAVVSYEPPDASTPSFGARARAAFCELDQRCSLGVFDDELVACAERMRQTGAFVEPRRAIAAGAVVLDEGLVDDCTRGIQELACDQAWRILRADGGLRQTCSQVATGQLGDGATCYSQLECAPGHRCVGLEAEACPGTCRQQMVPCADDVSDTPACPAPTRCDASGACVSPARAGEPCAQDFACTGALYCIDGVCDAGGELGAACDEQTPCVDGLSCRAEAGSSQTVCTAPVFGLAAGESCDDVLRNCGHALHCDAASGTCVPRLALGEACTAGQGLPCEQGLACIAGPAGDPLAEHCHPRRDVGQPCGAGRDCTSGVCEGGLCIERRDASWACFRP